MCPISLIILSTDWAISELTSHTTCLLITEARSFNSEYEAVLCKCTAMFRCTTLLVLPGHVNLYGHNKLGRDFRWWAAVESQTITKYLLHTALAKATLAAIYAHTPIRTTAQICHAAAHNNLVELQTWAPKPVDENDIPMLHLVRSPRTTEKQGT